MRTYRVIPSLFLLLLSTFSWAFAQNAPPRLEVFVEGGGSFLNGSIGSEFTACPAGVACAGSNGVTSSFSKAVRLFAGGRYRFTRHDALEASFSYSPNHFSVTQAGESAVSGYTRMDLLSCNYVRYLWTKTSFQPFVTGGVGGNGFGGLSNTSSSLSGLFNASNGWHFAWNFGGGADVVLQRHFAVRLELRDYQTGQPTPGAAITTGMGGTSHNIVPSAGIAYRFK
jgi:opacity protein-like surface antigen